MSDKKKKRVRALSNKTGMSHQAAVNVLSTKTILTEKGEGDQGFLSKLEFPGWIKLLVHAVTLVNLNPGYEYFPYDDPKEGKIGYLVMHPTMPDLPKHELEWYPFGRLEKTELVEFTNSHQAPFLIAHLQELVKKKLFRSDDPRRLLVGFVYYENKVSYVTHISLRLLKGMGNFLFEGQPFPKWRETVPSLRDISLEKVEDVPGLVNQG